MPADDLQETSHYRVRFDECGPDGLLRTSGLLRYAQDVAWIHSERLGFDRGWYTERGLAWLVRSASIDLLQPVPTGRRLTVTTRVVGFRRVTARRRTTFEVDGDVAAEVLTDWAMTDRRGLPARVPSDFGRFVTAGSQPFQPIKVALAPRLGDGVRIEFFVRRQDLDPMDHLNNAAYVDFAEEVLTSPAGVAAGADAIPTAVPRRYLVDYAAPASLGDRIVATAWREADGWAVTLARGDGQQVARARLKPV